MKKWWILTAVTSYLYLALGLLIFGHVTSGGRITEDAIELYFFITWIPAIFGLILHYKCWKALPEKYRHTSPGKAVGFLFIPFFNFFWWDVSFGGLTRGYYSFGQDDNVKEIKNHRLSIVLVPFIWIVVPIVIIFLKLTILGVLLYLISVLIIILFHKNMTSYARYANWEQRVISKRLFWI